MELDKEGHPVYFERGKFLDKAREAQKKLVEIDAIRSEYLHIVDACQDLY